MARHNHSKIIIDVAIVARMLTSRRPKLPWREEAHRRAMDGLPLGPADVTELAEWPIHAVAAGLVMDANDALSLYIITFSKMVCGSTFKHMNPGTLPHS